MQRESSVVRERRPASFDVGYGLQFPVVDLDDAQSSPEPPQLPADSARVSTGRADLVRLHGLLS